MNLASGVKEYSPVAISRGWKLPKCGIRVGEKVSERERKCEREGDERERENTLIKPLTPVERTSVHTIHIL